MWISVPGNYEYGFRSDVNRDSGGMRNANQPARNRYSHARNDFLKKP
jgi:hypothetical protein